MSGLLSKTIRSTTLRLALISIAAFGVIVFGLLAYVYFSTASYVRERLDHAVAAELDRLRDAYQGGGREKLMALIRDHPGDLLAGDVVLLADADFAFVAGTLEVWPPTLRLTRGWGDVVAPAKPGAATNPPLLRIAFDTLPNGDHMLVGKVADDLDPFIREIGAAMGMGALLICVLAAVASLSVTRRTVGRIEAINATSQAILQRGLGERIPLRGSRDEWDQLAQNLNLMLERIEGLVTELKQVTDNVAHDLRTPLARIRGRLEKSAAAQQFDPAVISDTLADLDLVLRMFSSLMRISLIETNEQSGAFRLLSLPAITRDVAELFDAAAEECGTRLTVAIQETAMIRGDRDLLFDALANLVDNALKHAGAAGEVTMEVAREADGSPTVSVADRGLGIPPEERERVFRRFYRLERSRHTPGNGLGLSLVAAVARSHAAEIDIQDNAPGLKLRLRFPRPPDEPTPDPPRA